jgi:hypothetical protein
MKCRKPEQSLTERNFTIVTDATLKVPKHEIFVTEFFILSDPIWVGDLRTKPKKPFVYAEYAVKIIPRLLSMR